MSESLRNALDLSLFWDYRNILFAGLLFNVGIFICAAVAAVVVGLVASLLRNSRHLTLRGAGTLYVEIFRNAPEYVMLLWVHLVLPLLIGVMIQQRVEFNPFFSAVVALGLVYSGYMAETFRSGFQSIPKGNIEAGRTLGMSELLILRRISLPQVVRLMLPEAMNNFVSLFKATTIVSLIAVPDMMYRVTMITQQEMRPVPLYTGAALTYFVVIFVFATLARAVTDKWRRAALI